MQTLRSTYLEFDKLDAKLMVKNEPRFLCCFFDIFNTKPTQGLKRTEFCACVLVPNPSQMSFQYFLVFACECCR